MNKLLTFLLSVVIYFKRSLRSHEIRIRLVMVRGRNLLSIKSQSYDCSNVILVLGLMRNCLVSSHAWLPINAICSLENLINLSLTFRKILIGIFIIFCSAFIYLTVCMILNNWLLDIISSLIILTEFSVLIELVRPIRALWIQNSWMFRFQAGYG